MVVGSEPKDTPFRFLDEADKKPAARRASTKIDAKELAGLFAGLLFFFGQSRPLYVREAWEWEPGELMPAAEPAARMMERMPAKAFKLVQSAMDPAAFIMAAYAIVNESQRRERVIHERFAKMVAESGGTLPGAAPAGGAQPGPSVPPGPYGAGNQGNGTGAVQPDPAGDAPRDPKLPFA